ncbi:MAG: hypothetical protein HYR72_15680 [Deltaproteobacteria bacterium]|nr:hypothetical protein [Deltaproteobacteria bacterium]MBI3387411.1 hypothetical protein [Deltaproteobacteria bacterium]
MDLFNMIAMNAALPQGMYDASVAPVLLGLVAVVFAIGSALALVGARPTAAPRRRLAMVQPPAFGVAR